MISIRTFYGRLATALIFISSAFIADGFGQRKAPARSAKPAPAETPVEAVKAEPPRVPQKKNGRPAAALDTAATSGRNPPKARENLPFAYRFERPEFLVPWISIEHDENGRGTISFKKNGSEEIYTDPLELSPSVIRQIKAAYDRLDFLNSTENYQYEKQYLHLGNMTITRRSADKERSASFNWTENKDAKVIADIYRKLGYQYVWQFDMAVARANQPLNAPSLMATLDSYITRGDIADASDMLPLLRELLNDERIPLIARNHAVRLIKQIEKMKK